MKKKQYYMLFAFLKKHNKLLNIMRLTILFSFICLVANSSTVFSQAHLFSLDLEKTKVKDVFKAIENQSAYRFFYNDQLSDINKVIDVSVSQSDIEGLLHQIFERTDISFTMLENNLIVAGPKRLIQSNKITGTITDALTGEPLVGVNVVIEGTTIGVISDSDGKFSIDLPNKGAVLLFSYIGYMNERITVSDQTAISVKMIQDITKLEEVVVVGYGTVKKRDLTGSVASVQGSSIVNIPVSNVAQAITGKLAGVQITTSEGEPGAEIKVRVRGGGSITQDNSPLYIIDGFPSDLGLNGVDPNDVQSIDVLKDASSTSIYGARGANGVVIITTKKGTEGKFNITYNGYGGLLKLKKTLPVLNAKDYVISQWERKVRLSTSDDYTDITSVYGEWSQLDELYGNKPYVDWQKEIFGRDAYTQSHNLGISGGTKTTKYNLNYTHNVEDGIMLNSSSNKDFFKLSLDQKANEHVSFSANVSYLEQKVEGAGTSVASETYSALVNVLQFRPTSGISGSNEDLIEIDVDPLSDDVNSINPVVLTESTQKNRKQNDLLMNAGIEFKILKGLTLKMSGGLNFANYENSVFMDERSKEARNIYGGPAGILENIQRRKWNYSNVLNYTQSIGKHEFTLMAGQEANELSYTYKKLVGNKFPNSDIGLANMEMATTRDLETEEYKEALLSFFGRVNYSFASRYLFSASLRQDGSSKFDTKNKYGYFPAASVAWRISEESFFEPLINYVSNFKVRYSYGSSGNNRIENYLYSTTYEVLPSSIGKISGTGVYPRSLANPDLRWETTTTSNVGVDLSFFRNRLSISSEIYRNKTKDLLLNADIPATSGYSKQILNIGSTENKGIEFVVNGVLVENKDFNWTADFNISFNRNKVLALNSGQQQFLVTSSVGYLSSDYIVKVGEPMGLMYGYVTDGIYTADDFLDAAFLNSKFTPANLKPDVSYGVTQGKETNLLGQPKIKRFGNEVDANGHIYATANDMQVIGNANPKHFGGFNTSMVYKGIDLSIFLNWVYGNDIYNATKLRAATQMYRNQNLLDIGGVRYTMIDPETGKRVLDRTRLNEINVNANMPAIPEKAETLTPWVIEDGSFLRINNITLGYSIPSSLLKRIHLQKFRVYATAYNIYTFTNYTGYDPEVDSKRSSPMTPGVDYAAYPRSRQFVVGVNVTF